MLDEAEARFREALDRSTAALGDEHPSTIKIGADLSDLLRETGRLEEAESVGRRPVSAARAALPPLHRVRRTALYSHGRVLTNLGRAADPDCGLGGVTVDSINPIAARRGTSGSVTISGAGFASGAIVTFENGQGPAPIASDVVVVSSATLTATVDVAPGGGNSTRFWDVRVTNPDSSTGVLLDGFAVFTFP